MNILVLDVGTSSMRGIFYNENGKKIFAKQVRYCPSYGSKGEVEQNPREFEDALILICKSVARQLKASCHNIDAIAISAQRSAVIPVDAKGEPLMNAIMWQDSRNKRICKDLERHNKKVSQLSGAKVNTVFFGGKIAWIKESKPKVFKETHKMLNVPSYLIYKMTGEYVTDYTYGSRTNLMNLSSQVWDQELLAIFKVREEQLCKLIAPGSICGRITKKFADKINLKEGIPVVSAGGDQQCAMIGQGAFKEGIISIVAGTGAFLATISDSVPEKLSPELICNCAAVKEKYIIEANVLTCCAAFDWFCENFYDGERIDYDSVNQDLEAVYETEEQCVVLPYFRGRSTPKWNSDATAIIANVTLATKRGDLLKALVEGIFMEINNNIQEFRKHVNINSAYISGGLTNSRVMNHMQANVYGMDLYHMEDSEATALGALMVTLTELGRYSSLEEAFRIIRTHDDVVHYTYKESMHSEYMKKQLYMNQLYDKIYE